MKCKHGHEINDGHYIELVDRIHIVLSNIDEHILNHPAACANPLIRSKVDSAINNLLDAYQAVEYDSLKGE